MSMSGTESSVGPTGLRCGSVGSDGASASPATPTPGPIAVLIGMMAAGKTKVGRELASRRGLPFHDLDHLIAEADGRDIPTIFAQDGEPAFRALEAQVLARALQECTGVLSLGGGAPMTPSSRALLATAPVVLIELAEELAAERLHRGKGRPMLAGEDPVARWQELAAVRLPVYREIARVVVHSSRAPASAVAREIDHALHATDLRTTALHTTAQRAPQTPPPPVSSTPEPTGPTATPDPSAPSAPAPPAPEEPP